MNNTELKLCAHRWAGNWKIDEDVQEISVFKLQFSESGQGILTIRTQGSGFVCSTFYSRFSQQQQATEFEFTFARGRMRGEFFIDTSRKMQLTVKDCSLPQLPTNGTFLRWQMARC